VSDAEKQPDAREDEAPSDADERDEPALPPVQPVAFDTLLDDYRDKRVGRSPWNWAALPSDHRETLVKLVDGFVASYNQWWAMTDAQLVPPCWPRHPALAYDLAALAWTFHWAYLDRQVTPDRAARFQAQLVPFADRLERWLGEQPDECRAGRHARDWRRVSTTGRHADRSSAEYCDAVALLGTETFGFEQAER
jgi:hypothetical protein